MIIKNVPYINDKEENFASCQGPPSVLMVFKYFFPNNNMTFQRLYKGLNYTHATWFFEVYIVRFFYKYKVPIKYYSTTNLFTIGDDARKFDMLTGLNYKKHEDRDEIDIENYDSAVNYVLNNNLFEKRNINIEFIRSKIKKGKLIIATINRNILTGKNGFKGHFIVLKGFNEKGFICNDAYIGEDIKISYNKFKEAFYSYNNDGSMEADIVVVG